MSNEQLSNLSQIKKDEILSESHSRSFVQLLDYLKDLKQGSQFWQHYFDKNKSEDNSLSENSFKNSQSLVL